MKKSRLLIVLSASISLIVGVMWLLGSGQETAVHAATFTVNSTADAVDANPGDGSCATSGGLCTLRAAIQEANALPGDDVITLPAGTYTFTISGSEEDAAETGDLDITDALTINGANSQTTIIDAAVLDRVFQIFADTTLSEVTIQNGSGFDPSIFSCGGGGIRLNSGNLTISNSIIRNNSAVPNNTGGGICIFSFSNVFITDSIIDANSAVGSGGGIYMGLPSNISLVRSTVSNNTGYYGGGIYFGAGQGSTVLSLELSQILSNTATGGGGGVNFSANNGYLEIVASTFSGNQIPAYGQYLGGGLLIGGENNTVNISHSTFRNNASNAYHGGGLANLAKYTALIINETTFENNTARTAGGGIYSWAESVTMTSQDSIFSGNTAGSSGGGIYTGNLTHTVSITNGRFIGNTVTNPDSWGGGINMRSLTSTLTIVDGLFNQNASSTLGGAIYLFPSTSTLDTFGITAEIMGTSFSANEAGFSGGAVYQGTGTAVTIDQSSFVGNTAIGGGAYASYSDGMTGVAQGAIENSTFSNNQTYGSGGAIHGMGSMTNLALRNVTVANNVADMTDADAGHGGGFALQNGASMQIANSLIANNTDWSGVAPDCYNPNTQVSQGANLIGDATGCNWSAAPDDLIGTAVSPIDPVLEPLTGLLPYHPLGTDSPAIDAGSAAPITSDPDMWPGCRPLDQIGTARPKDGNANGTAVCDIGAIEYVPESVITERFVFLPLIVQ